jgi:hypothetical protein
MNCLWLWNAKNHWHESVAPILLQSLHRGLWSSWTLPQTCAVVSVALKFDHGNSQSGSILNTLPQLQLLSEASVNALAKSESTLQSCKGTWEDLEVLRSTGEGYRRLLELWVWLPDWFTFCWWIITVCILHTIVEYPMSRSMTVR